MDIVEWRSGLQRWLDELSSGLEPGRFRFCLKGDRVPSSGKTPQFSTCFAAKTAWQAGIWKEWSEEKRRACIDLIQSFQTVAGYFEDPWLAKETQPNLKEKAVHLCRTILGRVSSNALQERQVRNVRAETRQSAATLLMVGERPLQLLPIEVSTPADVRAYLESFDWTAPWSAGSHLSHLVFLLSANQALGVEKNKYDPLIDEVYSFLKGLWNREYGCWFRGNPSNLMKINGAMKVLSGLHWLDRPYPDCRKIMDLAIQQPFAADGCGFVNRLFVVHEAKKGVPAGYREQEIRDLALTALSNINRFRRRDGGFSFNMHGAQTEYYGAKVSEGRMVGDLHGAAMMTWGVALSLAMLGDTGIPGSNEWRVHRA